MKKSVFNIFRKSGKKFTDKSRRVKAKKITFNTASYSDFQYKDTQKEKNTLKDTPIYRDRKIQSVQKQGKFRFPKIHKRKFAIILAVVITAVTVPILFATAAKTNEVATIAEIKSQPSPTVSAVQSTNGFFERVDQKAATTDGQLTGDLTETLSQASPVVEITPSPAVPSAQAAWTLAPSPTSDPAAADDIDALTSQSTATAETAFITFTPGTNDPFVSMIQQRLMDLDYMESDETTTLFGPTTSQAISFFQRKNNLPQDGVAGPGTLQVLFSNSALHYTVSEGADGPDVESIQERLEDLGYNISVTGYFGTDTTKAVIAFQKRNDLTDDGNVGAGTKELLYSNDARGPSGKQSSSSSGSSSSGSSDSSGGSTTYIANPGSVEAFVKAALSQVGVPYRLGGKNSSSLDCSGLVYYALKLSGNGIGYMTSGGWANASQYPRINSMKDLRRGDIVAVRGHVGIYLGDGTVVHASSSNGKVVVSGNIFNSSYWTSNWICGRRPL